MRAWFAVFLIACGESERGPGAQDAGPGEDAAVDASSPGEMDSEVPQDLGLVLNELMASNDGVWVDEQGEVDDWLELYNQGDQPIRLADFGVSVKGAKSVALPDQVLAPGEVLLLWADKQVEQGPLHLPFKLDKDGSRVELRRLSDGVLADRSSFGGQATDVSQARLPDGSGEWSSCRYATPSALNGAGCEPKLPNGFDGDATFAPFSWPADFGVPQSPLIVSELALHPAAFIELENIGSAPLSLEDWAVNIAPLRPGQSWPSNFDGVMVDLPALTELAPGERLVLSVDEGIVSELSAGQDFEGVVTLYHLVDLDVQAVERVDFNRWPSGAVLSRTADHRRFRYCTNNTKGSADACTELASRDVGDRLRQLHTPGDFAALAKGGSSLGMAPVKFVIEGQGTGPVHLLSSARWPLHFTFIREVIQGETALDRCDTDQNALFEAEFSAFIASEYLSVETRSYLLGSLVHHVGPNLHTVEFTSGDAISPAQIQAAFFADMGHVPSPKDWFFHPVDESQLERARSLDGKLPIVGPNAPYEGLTFQPLTPAVAYGTLTFVPTDQLASTRLGPDVIVVTDDVPNDIELVGGLVTEAFQTPLSHVNLLSQARDTPNMALSHARTAPELVQLFGELVRLEVRADGFSVAKADPVDAQKFWQSRVPQGPLFQPKRDTSVRGVIDLSGRGVGDLPLIGAKAAQLAELAKVTTEREGCAVLPIRTPKSAFALPVVHYIEHFARSGAEAKFEALRKDPAFASDPSVRSAGLAEVRALIAETPVEPGLLSELTSECQRRFGSDEVRFRSSSNAEDLEGFNGAGLYTSESAAAGESEAIEAALHTVWSSLWDERAYDERTLAGIDHTGVAMGVLVHPRFVGERANGVAMSRNLNDPTRGDQFYVNAQVGEASVTNPAPGVGTEQVVYTWPPNTPELTYRSHSTLTQGKDVLASDEIRELACALGALHDHFEALMNADGKNRWFTMEVEFKVVGDARDLVIKQARPFPFSAARLPADCRGVAK
ncbi:MAG: PEP/pyruvate-binding domain-containing protein [Myxococcales bacterium]